MATLTIYTGKYDIDGNVVNNGMSGKAFLDMDDGTGIPFKCVDDALDHIVSHGVRIHTIEFDYVDASGIQSFRKFKISPRW